jgi:hypothetical protein
VPAKVFSAKKEGAKALFSFVYGPRSRQQRRVANAAHRRPLFTESPREAHSLLPQAVAEAARGLGAAATRESVPRQLAGVAAAAALAAANADAGADTHAKFARLVLNCFSSIQCSSEPSGELPCALLSARPRVAAAATRTPVAPATAV